MERRGRIRDVSAGAEAARVPPHDLDAERAVIGAMLVSETAVAAVAEKLAPEDFYSEVHRIIYGAMMRLYARGDPIDQLTLTNELRSVNEFEKVGGRAYVFQIVESVPTAANASRYAEIVRGKALLRAVIDVGSRITEDAFREPEDVNEALDAAEQLIYGVSNRTLREHLTPMSELAPGALEMIQKLYEAEGEVTGVETGFEDLDRLTTGFHKSDLVILAARPAMGKCLKWDSLVVDPSSGERLTIEQCVRRRLPHVLSVSSGGKVRPTSISNWIDSGIKPCFRVTTRTGRSVEVTGHHPFLTVKGWTPLHDLHVGAHIAVPRSVPIFGEDESWPLDRVRLLAHFIAEDGLTRPSPKWSNADPSLVEDFRESLRRQFPEVVVKQDGSRSWDYKVVRPDRGRGMDPNPVTAWLRDLGLMGKYAEEKFFPSCVWKWSRRYLAEFLRVLFSCDGTIYKLGNYPRIEFSVSSQRLARDVHHALTRFGIVAKLWRKKMRCWRVEITAPDSVLRYQAEIGWIGEKALCFTGGALAQRALPRRGSDYGHPPREVWDLVREATRRREISLSELGRSPGETMKTGKYAGYNPHTGRRLPSYRLARHAEILKDEALLRAASSDLLWDEIVSIEFTGDHQVYDLTVPDGSNFIAQDICVHNTAMALNAIWHAAGQKGMPVAIFSLEMSKEQLVQRLISQTTRIPTQALRSGNVRAEDWPKLVRGVAEVSRAPIWIDDTAGVTLMEMRAKVRRLSSRLAAEGKAPLALVVVDYLQLMVGQNNRSENRQQEIAEISRGLKVLARDLDVPVLAIAQLSRAVEQRHDKRPLLSDLRDSGALEQDADMVMFLYRDEYYNPESDDKGIAEVIVGKHRNGPTGKIQLAWMEQYTKFASLARRV
jgi:replicative DNA helicase